MGKVFHEFEGCNEQFVSEGNLNELGAVPLCVAPGVSCVEHSHVGVEEVLIVRSGRGRVEIENDWFDVCEGSVALVRSGEFHAIHNTGTENLEVFAVVNANVDFDTIVVKSRAQHFAAKQAERAPDRAELVELREKLSTLSELLDEVRGELASLREPAKAKRSRGKRAA